MGQVEILEVLEKAKTPLSRGEIANLIKQEGCRVSHSIKRLEKHNEIKSIEIDRKKAKKYYNCNRRMKLYYI